MRASVLTARGRRAAPPTLRDRMLGWAAQAAARLDAAGVAVDVRDAGPRRGLRGLIEWVPRDTPAEGIVFFLRVSAARMEIGLRVPAGALGAVGVAELAGAVAALPDPFLVGREGKEGGKEAHGVTAAMLRSLVADEQAPALWVGWSMPRQIAMEASEVLDDQLEDALVTLSSVLDALSRPSPTRLPSPARAPRARAAEPKRRGLGIGARVRVARGPLEGRTGVIEALDGKGNALVRLGALGARVPLDALAEPSPARRPVLGSSHRRRPSRG
jgi:hypothetical protein